MKKKIKEEHLWAELTGHENAIRAIADRISEIRQELQQAEEKE